MTDELMPLCPLVNGYCSIDCMWFLTESTEVRQEISDEGEGHCAIAVLASHVASEEHIGGNYLMKTIGYRRKEMEE